MIAPQELRIGNLVEVEGSIVKVDAIDDTGINLYVYHNGDREHEGFFDAKWRTVKPIPLDEGWLQKFGFRQDKNNNTLYSNGSAYQFDLKYQDIWLPIVTKDGDSDNTFICNNGGVKYVHQLQNLYYCLTGEELTAGVAI